MAIKTIVTALSKDETYNPDFKLRPRRLEEIATTASLTPKPAGVMLANIDKFEIKVMKADERKDILYERAL